MLYPDFKPHETFSRIVSLSLTYTLYVSYHKFSAFLRFIMGFNYMENDPY